MSTMPKYAELALEGVFLHLVKRGFRLSVRDLQNGLRALEAGYGVCSREDLQWLCEALWARSEEEVQALHHFFREFPLPRVAEVAALTGRPQPEASAQDTRAGAGDGPRTKEQDPVLVPQYGPATGSGAGLPTAQVTGAEEPFILSPRPAVSLRSLIVTWRRYRRPQRSGPRVELDLDATIAEQARRRILAEPVMVPARRNQARLTILVDVSPSMSPWHNLHGLVAESLHAGLLAQGALYYFHNVPGEHWYETESLTSPVPVQDLTDGKKPGQTQSPLLVVSDAGAARGSSGADRVQDTAGFLVQIAGAWQPVAWVNPMPRRRWVGTTADQIARLKGLSMVELTEDGLTQAIDILRGQRTG
jgi:uncharacterized protein with von Willebrand factor type A (vWA) domain